MDSFKKRTLGMMLLAGAVMGMGYSRGGIDPEPFQNEPYRRDVSIKPAAPVGKQQRKRNRKKK